MDAAGKAVGDAGALVDLSTLSAEADDRRLLGSVRGLVRYTRGAVLLAREALPTLARSKVDAALLAHLEALSRTLRQAQVAWLQVARGAAASALQREEAERAHLDLRSALSTFAAHDAETRQQLVDIGQAESLDDLVEDLDRLIALAQKHRADLEGTDVDAARVAAMQATRDAFAALLEKDGVAVGRPMTPAQRDLRRARNRVFHALWEQTGLLVARMRHGFRHEAALLARLEALPSPRYARGAREEEAEAEGEDGAPAAG